MKPALLLIFTPLLVAQTVEWKVMIPTIREILMTESKTNPEFAGVGERYSIGIEKIADVTGDGLPEALISLGTGGASTDEMTVMRIENLKPVLAIFRNREGRLSHMVFVMGASVMHSNGVEMLPQEHAVYSMHYIYSGDGKLHECGGEAYSWNTKTKTFDFNSGLTRKLTKRTCRQVPRTVGEAETAK